MPMVEYISTPIISTDLSLQHTKLFYLGLYDIVSWFQNIPWSYWYHRRFVEWWYWVLWLPMNIQRWHANSLVHPNTSPNASKLPLTVSTTSWDKKWRSSSPISPVTIRTNIFTWQKWMWIDHFSSRWDRIAVSLHRYLPPPQQYHQEYISRSWVAHWISYEPRGPSETSQSLCIPFPTTSRHHPICVTSK